MNGRLRLGLLALITVALAATAFQPQALLAQEASARFRVMVPDMPPAGNENKKFGERFAEELRDLINDMATHQPVEEKEIKDALKRFDLKMEDLDCAKSRQLGQQIMAEMVFCGSYSSEGEGWHVEGSFVSSSGEAFDVEPLSVEDRGEKVAAQHFFAALELMSEQLRFAQFCGEYASSEVWESAMTACDRASEKLDKGIERLRELVDDARRLGDPRYVLMVERLLCQALLSNKSDSTLAAEGKQLLSEALARAEKMEVKYEVHWLKQLLNQ